MCAYSIITRKQKFKLLFAVDITLFHETFSLTLVYFFLREICFFAKDGVKREKERDKMTVARGKCCQLVSQVARALEGK